MGPYILHKNCKASVLFAPGHGLGRVLGIVYRVIATHLVEKAWLYQEDRPDRVGDLDPAFRQCVEPQHPLSYTVPRWRVYQPL